MTTSGIENAIRAHGRGLLVYHCNQEKLLTRVVIDSDGQIVTVARSWNEYWAPVYEAAPAEVVSTVDDLHNIWKRYIQSSFTSELQLEYCYRYFQVLDALLRVIDNASALSRDQMLGTVLGFECIGIAGADSPDVPIVAGTFTLRNPCYLLAKLKIPDAIDDCRYLPLITVAVTSKPQLYYHYRQHKLSADSDNSLLLYVCADQQLRSVSFRTLNTFEQKLWQSSDPRVESRAKLIAQRMILPYLTQEVSGANEQAIEIIDLGAGSGLLTSRICQILKDALLPVYNGLLFRVWMIDLNTCIPARFFGAKRLRDKTDWLVSVGIDYQKWLRNRQCLPKKAGIRIGLIVRFFHNMSDFHVDGLSCADVAQKSGFPNDPTTITNCLPARCLEPTHVDPQALQVSNTRIELSSGHSFVQLSLSPYNQGLSLLKHSNMQRNTGTEKTVFLPVRSFNRQCLMTSDGQSIIARMLDECSLLVIQDMDLRPLDVRGHCERQGLSHLAVLNVGKGLGLKSYYCYLVLYKDDPALVTLKGERVW